MYISAINCLFLLPKPYFKMTQTNFKRKPLSLSIYCVVCILCNITFVRTNECKKLSPCSCDCDGNIIDLKDLANKAGGDPK